MPFQTVTNLYNTTKFIVDPDDNSAYDTIQSGVNAANAVSGGKVIVRKVGVITEDLTLYTNILIEGMGEDTIINGTHTMPLTGDVSFRNITLQDNSLIIQDAGAATTTNITMDNVFFDITVTGVILDTGLWTGGDIYIRNCLDISLGLSTVFTNGAATYHLYYSMLGKTNQTSTSAADIEIFGGYFSNELTQSAGTLDIYNSTLQSDITLTNVNVSMYNSWLNGTFTLAGTTGGIINNNSINSGADIAITHNGASTLYFNINEVSTTNQIATGTGTIVESLNTWTNGANSKVGMGTTAITAETKTEIIGDDIQIIMATNNTDTTTKEARLACKHYTNAEEPMMFLYGLSTATDNTLSHGGGTTLGNAATAQDFYIGASTTALTGEVVFSLDGNGAALFKNRIDSTTGFQIFEEAAAGMPIFNADTSNFRIGVLTNAPDSSIHLQIADNDTTSAFKVGNATHYLTINNGTGTGYVPQIVGVGSASTKSALYFQGNVLAGDDAGVTPVIQIETQMAVGADITARPLLNIRNNQTAKFLFDYDGSLGVNLTVVPDFGVDINHATGDCLKLIYNDANGGAANYANFNLSAAGDLTITPSSGNRLMPAQPSFYSYTDATAANATGDGTAFTILYNQELFDQNSDFNTGTNTFTAPSAGIYFFEASVLLDELAAAHTTAILTLQSSVRPYRLAQINGGAARDAADELILAGNAVIPMAAAETVNISVVVSGGAIVVDVLKGDTNAQGTHFAGYLIH